MRLSLACSLLVALLALLVLSGCTTAQKMVAQAGIQKVKDAHDTAAVVTLMLPCGIRIGSFYRALNPNQQRAVEALCGGDPMPRPSKLRTY